MAKRSLKSSSIGIIRAKEAFEKKGWTQEYLASEVGLSSRQSIWKFFTGRPIERYLFKEICFKLDLNWDEIAELPQTLLTRSSLQEMELEGEEGVNAWVRKMRLQLRDLIQTQCNTLQPAFDLTQPLLEQIYILVNILPRPSNQRWLEVSDLQELQSTTKRPNLTSLRQEAVPAMQIINQHDKLMILGKPGAGKTTFLQYIALQSNQNRFKPDLVPLFLQLRTLNADTVEEEDFSLVSAILNYGERCNLSSQQTTELIEEGKFLLLLDGLDEVSQEESEWIFQEVNQFSQTYFKNTIYLTCRSGIQKYYFRNFTNVEIADFNQKQIEEFAKKWFLATANNKAEGLRKAEQFFEQLERPINQPIRDLVVTPILLNLICSVFKEKANFPTKRAKLYQAGLDILLQRWDQARGIQRDRIYRYLSLTDKIKLLCQIAATTFEKNNYFFESSEVLYIIEDYLQSLPEPSNAPEILWLNSEAVLKAIEFQHGLLVERARDIYSFSHLTFQEYLTARKIVANSDPQALQQDLQKLARNAADSRWREVILLTASMLPKADYLLEQMQNQLYTILQQDRILQEFLVLINQKVLSLQLPGSAVAIRAFYFTLLQSRDLNLVIALDVNFASLQNLPEALNLDLTLARAFIDSLNLVKSAELNLKKFFNLCFTLDLEGKFSLESAFAKALKDLKEELPDLQQGKASIQQWWRVSGQAWVEQFRQILITYRQIGHDWKLSREQSELWQQYYRLNQFIVECLYSDCQISPTIKEKIENTLLLPFTQEQDSQPL